MYYIKFEFLDTNIIRFISSTIEITYDFELSLDDFSGFGYSATSVAYSGFLEHCLHIISQAQNSTEFTLLDRKKVLDCVAKAIVNFKPYSSSESCLTLIETEVDH